jgi:hypothetical protein
MRRPHQAGWSLGSGVIVGPKGECHHAWSVSQGSRIEARGATAAAWWHTYSQACWLGLLDLAMVGQGWCRGTPELTATVPVRNGDSIKG